MSHDNPHSLFRTFLREQERAPICGADLFIIAAILLAAVGAILLVAWLVGWAQSIWPLGAIIAAICSWQWGVACFRRRYKAWLKYHWKV